MSARARREILLLEAPPSQRLTDEQEAFLRGADTTRPDARNPFNKARLRTAWAFGRRFGEQDRRGLRPLDTARRIA